MARSDADVVFHVASYGMSGREQVGRSRRERAARYGREGRMSRRTQVGQGREQVRIRCICECLVVLSQLNKALIEAVNVDGTRNLIEG